MVKDEKAWFIIQLKVCKAFNTNHTRDLLTSHSVTWLSTRDLLTSHSVSWLSTRDLLTNHSGIWLSTRDLLTSSVGRRRIIIETGRQVIRFFLSQTIYFHMSLQTMTNDRTMTKTISAKPTQGHHHLKLHKRAIMERTAAEQYFILSVACQT